MTELLQERDNQYNFYKIENLRSLSSFLEFHSLYSISSIKDIKTLLYKIIQINIILCRILYIFRLKNFLRYKYRNYFIEFSKIESFEYKYNRREIKKLPVSSLL